MSNKFVIEVRTKGFEMLEAQMRKADAATKGYEKTAGKSRGTTSGLRREIGALRNNLLLYTFAIGSAARVTGTFIRAASDAQENLSKFKTVFGDASTEALDFATTLADSFQRSESEIIALMSSLQDTFVPLGFSRDAARQLSQALAQLSFDVGSFNNVASPEVAQAFTSAIVGNHEAVRRFGIVLTEAQLKQTALQLGIIKTERELNAQEKVLARTAVIFQSTSDAQGDLIRTQDEFANRARAVQSEIHDLREEIGAFLIPLAEIGLEFGNVERIKGYAAALTTVAVGYGIVRTATFLATASQVAFKSALIKSGIGIAVVLLGELAARFIFARDETDKGVESLTDYKKALEDITKVTTNSSAPDRSLKLVFQQRGNEIIKISDELRDVQIRNQNQRRESFLAAQKEIDAFREQSAQTERIQLEERRNSVLVALQEQKQLEEEMANQREKDARRQIENSVRVANGFRQFSDLLGQAVLDGQDFGEAFTRSLDAITAKIAAEFASFAILSLITGGTATASQLGFSTLGALIGHSGGKITSKGIQKFANGGPIQGRDNVPILAQAGEYIIKRDSAESIGLDKLNEINETGQTGSLTVNISAPLVDETVVDTIIPAIQKASRFNLA